MYLELKLMILFAYAMINITMMETMAYVLHVQQNGIYFNLILINFCLVPLVLAQLSVLPAKKNISYQVELVLLVITVAKHVMRMEQLIARHVMNLVELCQLMLMQLSLVANAQILLNIWMGMAFVKIAIILGTLFSCYNIFKFNLLWRNCK